MNPYHSIPLLPVAVCLITGTATGFFFDVGLTLWPLLALLVVAAMFSGRWPRVQSMLLLMAVAVLGALLAGEKQKALRAWTFDQHDHRLQLVVASEPVEKPKTVAFDAWVSQNGRLLKCYVVKDSLSMQLMPGDGLLIQGRIEPNSDYRKGRFDYGRYLTEHGFSGRCYAGKGRWKICSPVLSELPLTDRARLTFLRWRHHLLSRYRVLSQLPDDRYAVLAAMTLGDKSALSSDLRDVYSVAGASHVLALSGLHLGILYFILSCLFIGRRRASLWSQVVLVVAVWAFALLVGLPVSLVRSATMLTVFAVFSVGGRRKASVNVLCLAAIILLLQNPYTLHDVGFQLSFLSVFSILLLMPLFEKWVGMEWLQRHRLAGALFGFVAVSVAAQVGVAPLVAYYYGRFPVYFLLTNFIAVPAAYLILGGSLLMLLIPWAPIAHTVLFVVDGLNSSLSFISRLPLASIEGLHPSPLQVWLAYLFLAVAYALLRRLSAMRKF